jgi:hypothetical protein
MVALTDVSRVEQSDFEGQAVRLLNGLNDALRLVQDLENTLAAAYLSDNSLTLDLIRVLKASLSQVAIQVANIADLARVADQSLGYQKRRLLSQQDEESIQIAVAIIAGGVAAALDKNISDHVESIGTDSSSTLN